MKFKNKSACAQAGNRTHAQRNENSNLIQKRPWPGIELTHPREMKNQMKFRKRHSLESNSRIHGSQAPMKRIVSSQTLATTRRRCRSSSPTNQAAAPPWIFAEMTKIYTKRKISPSTFQISYQLILSLPIFSGSKANISMNKTLIHHHMLIS